MAYSTEGWLMNFHFSKLFRYENAYNCHPINKPFVSAVLFGFHGTNLLKNLVSRELLRNLENFHFSISISKHFDFTFHFSKKSESILISLCTSRKRVKAFFFHFALLEKEWKLFIFTFHFSNFKNLLSLVPAFYSNVTLVWFATVSRFCHFLGQCKTKLRFSGMCEVAYVPFLVMSGKYQRL